MQTTTVAGRPVHPHGARYPKTARCGWCDSPMPRKPTGISRRATIVCRACVDTFLARSKEECQRQWR